MTQYVAHSDTHPLPKHEEFLNTVRIVDENI